MANRHEPQHTGRGDANDAPGPPLSDANVLKWAGRLLFGEEHWRAGLEKLLQVNRRTLQRWLNGQNEIPDGVWLMLRGFMAAKISVQRSCIEIIRCRQELSSATKEEANVATNQHN
jgi:hypothetical protein